MGPLASGAAWSPRPPCALPSASSRKAAGPDGGRWWEMEMRATTEDFELEGPHRAGDQWRMMLGINHLPAWMQARIPCRGPYLDPYGFNLMTLVDDTPAVQMTMDSIPNLATDGTARVAAQEVGTNIRARRFRGPIGTVARMPRILVAHRRASATSPAR